MLDSQKLDLLISISNNPDGYVTADKLANQFDLSKRTVIRYISDINSMINTLGCNIASFKGLGYKLFVPNYAKSDFAAMLNQYKMSFDINNKDHRLFLIVIHLLNVEGETIYGLSELLHFSSSSIYQLKNELIELLANYNLELVIGDDLEWHIKGIESDIRKIMLDILMKVPSIYYQVGNIDDALIAGIDEILTNNLYSNGVLLNDFDIKILNKLILICILRSKKHSESSHMSNLANPIINDILRDIEWKYDINFTDYDIFYISNYIDDVLKNSQFIKDRDLERIIYECLKSLNFFDDKVPINKDFLERLSMHIGLLIKRNEKNVFVENPIIKEIKANIPVEFNIAVMLINKLNHYYNINLNENEIGFIALHLASYTEKSTSTDNYKVIILCHLGLGYCHLLKEKINSRYENFKIIEIYPGKYFDSINNSNADLLITTTPIDLDVDIPVVLVDDIFSNELYKGIDKVIIENSQPYDSFKSLFSEERFFTDLKNQDKYDLINEIGEKLIAQNAIDKNTLNEVIKREHVSSTKIGNLVAIPHCVSSSQSSSLIAVGLTEEPVVWDDEKIQMIIFICFSENDTSSIKVFNYLYDLVRDEATIMNIVKNKSYDYLYEILFRER